MGGIFMNKFKIKHFLLLMVLSQILFTTSFTNCNNDSFLKELKEHPSFEMEKYSLYYTEYQNNHNYYLLKKVLIFYIFLLKCGKIKISKKIINRSNVCEKLFYWTEIV